MIGLMFFGVIFLWFSICFSLLIFVSIKKYGYLSKIFSLIFGVILLVVPFWDEIIGKREFEEICKDEVVVAVSEDYVRGKTVSLHEVKTVKSYKHTLPLITQHWSFKDVVAGEILISWNEYRSEGGWISRRIKLLGDSGPFTFNGFCYSKGGRNLIFNKLEIKKIQRTEK